jgi:chromosome segregation ATPase
VQRHQRQLNSLRHQLQTARAETQRADLELVNLRKSDEQRQAQLDTLGRILEENSRLQKDLDESKQLCSQLQLQLSDSAFVQQCNQKAQDELKQQLITSNKLLSQFQQQVHGLTSQFSSAWSALIEVQAQLEPQAARFDPTASDLRDSVRQFAHRISAKLPAPWASVQSQVASRDVQIEELTAANVSYAQEVRELRARLTSLSSQRR